MKKLLALLLTLVLLATALVGCGNNNNPPSNNPEQPSSSSNGDSTTDGNETVGGNETTNSNETTDGDENIGDETTDGNETTDNKPSYEEPKGSDGLEYKLSSDGQYYSVIGIGSCTDVDIVIPDTHEGLHVKEIANDAFERNFDIRTVTLGKNITTIGSRAFTNCISLYEVKNTDGVQVIRDKAFYGCRQITSFVLPSSITSFGTSVFADCIKLTQIYVLTDAVKVNEYTCSSVLGRYVPVIYKSLDIPSALDITEDGYIFRTKEVSGETRHYLINYIGTETTLHLPRTYKNEIYELHGAAFAYLINLEGVTIPDTISVIPYMAFQYCMQLKSIEGMEYISTIEGNAFNDCYNLRTIELSNNLTYLSVDIFNQSGITSITLPKSLSHSEKSIFRNCYKLMEVYDLSPLSIDYDTSYSVNGTVYWKIEKMNNSIDTPSILETDSNGFVFVLKDDGNYYLVDYIGNAETVILPESYKGTTYRLNSAIFMGNFTVKSVAIPGFIDELSRYMFVSCYNLESITYNGTKADWETAYAKWGSSIYIPSGIVVTCTDGNVTIE